MVVLKPFVADVPKRGEAERVASPPYDVVSLEEAKAYIENKPEAFLRVDLPEAVTGHQDKTLNMTYASEQLRALLEERYEQTPSTFFVYRLSRDGRTQTGLVATFSARDYEEGRIKIHELTREVKEAERIQHVESTQAHTGPIFLCHRPNGRLRELLHRATEADPLFAFHDEEGTLHEGFILEPKHIPVLLTIGTQIRDVYIADGHHRAKAAAEVAKQPLLEGESKVEKEHFLGVLFPSDELVILPYHRVLNPITESQFELMLAGVQDDYEVERVPDMCLPNEKGTFGVSFEGRHYRLARKHVHSELDAQLLQEDVLGPYFQVKDPRSDERLTFVGGRDAAERLSALSNQAGVLVLSCHATSMQELLGVADARGQMPPKSTWFDPKLKSGLFVHRFA